MKRLAVGVLLWSVTAQAAADVPLEQLNRQIAANLAALGARIAALSSVRCLSKGGQNKLAALHASVATTQASFNLGYQSYSGLVKSEIKGTGEQNVAMATIAAASGARAKLTAEYLTKVRKLNRDFSAQYESLFKNSYISTSDDSRRQRCAAEAGKIYDGVEAQMAETQREWDAYSGKLLALKKDFEAYQTTNGALAGHMNGSAPAAPAVNSGQPAASTKLPGVPAKGRDSGVSGTEESNAKESKSRAVISR